MLETSYLENDGSLLLKYVYFRLILYFYGSVEVSFSHSAINRFSCPVDNRFHQRGEKERNEALTRLSHLQKMGSKQAKSGFREKSVCAFSKRVNKTVETESSTITQTSSVIHLDYTGANTHTKQNKTT